MKIGIIGNGFVGKATKTLQCADIQVLVYDIKPELCEPANLSLQDLKVCNIIFISVPTPMNKDGTCHLNIVESAVNNIRQIKELEQIPLVIRSTVPPGTCDKLQTYFMPEFLTEKNYIQDFINCQQWVFGLLRSNEDNDNLFRETISKLFTLAQKNGCIKYTNFYFVSNQEAEMIKYVKNCYLATKVSFFNEIYQFCQLKNINYDNVKDIVILDNRITPSHTTVPGPDGKFGFGGTCFPKDTLALSTEMQKAGMKSYILQSVIDRNTQVDRAEKDWENKKGRTII